MKIFKSQKTKRNLGLFNLSKKFAFKLMTPEECLVNMKNSQGRTDMQKCTMNPLPEASKIKFLIRIYLFKKFNQIMILKILDFVYLECRKIK